MNDSRLTNVEPKPLTVGSFPYAPEFNPYQRLFTEALEGQGVQVNRIPPRKAWPLSAACSEPIDVLHLDWHYDWYRGRNWLTRVAKSIMYQSGLRACRRLPVVWTAHNLAAHDVSRGPKTDQNFDHRMTQALIDRCRGIMVMSHASEELLRQRYSIPEATRIVRAHHGHYIDCYENTISRAEAREQLSLSAAQNVFLSLGSLRRYKGNIELIDSFGRIATPEDRLIIAGKMLDPSHADELRQRIQSKSPEIRERIRLMIEEIPENELQCYFAAADVCVLPFSDVLNSGSLLLAMSFGKPVVAPSIGSIPEIALGKYHQGYSPTDPMGLADALVAAKKRFVEPNAVVDSKIRKRQTETIIADVRERYSWNTTGAAVAKFYQELLDRDA